MRVPERDIATKDFWQYCYAARAPRVHEDALAIARDLVAASSRRLTSSRRRRGANARPGVCGVRKPDGYLTLQRAWHSSVDPHRCLLGRHKKAQCEGDPVHSLWARGQADRKANHTRSRPALSICRQLHLKLAAVECVTAEVPDRYGPAVVVTHSIGCAEIPKEMARAGLAPSRRGAGGIASSRRRAGGIASSSSSRRSEAGRVPPRTLYVVVDASGRVRAQRRSSSREARAGSPTRADGARSKRRCPTARDSKRARHRGPTASSPPRRGLWPLCE